MKKYVCTVCGWVYDPEVGDPDGGIAPGTPFEEIPYDWVCSSGGLTECTDLLFYVIGFAMRIL